MRPLALALLLTAACQEHSAPAAPTAPDTARRPAAPATVAATPTADAGAWTTAQQACVDGWLDAHGLDAYGSPRGTLYSGGTPLFDETTGRATPRQAFLSAHHPEVLRACGL
jgi:hypothetical protein